MHRGPSPARPLPSAFRRAVLPVAVLALLAVPGAALPGPADRAGTASPAPAGSAVWPLLPAPEVVAGFDPPATRWGAGHRGVDLAGAPGQPVRAALAGTVTFAGSLAGRGVVVVDHGATRTTYEPVDAVGRASATWSAPVTGSVGCSAAARTARRGPACTGACSRARPTSTR